MGISPNIIELEPNQTQQFIQTGIGSSVWTLEGVGSLNQSGLYTAPNSAGSSKIRVHSSIWNYVGSSWTKNADDSLTATGTINYFGAAKSNVLLNNVGDFVIFKIMPPYPYWVGLENDAETVRIVLAAAVGGKIAEYHPNGNVQSGNLTYASGQFWKFELITGGYVQVSRDGTIVYTSVNNYLNKNLRFTQDGVSNSGDILPAPYFSAANYTEYQASVTTNPPILLSKMGLELYCEANKLSLTNDAVVASFTDLSGKGRNLTASSNQPVFKTSDNRIEFDGTKSPLKNNAQFQINCGFILAKCNQSTFSNNAGLLSGNEFLPILLGSTGTNKFFDLKGAGDSKFEYFEFRTNDRIYPQSNQLAPMQAWQLIFFRFWQPQITDGIQIGCDRLDSTRKWNGAVKLLALYSRNFCENDIRSMAKTIADDYSLTLVDVFPFQADTSSEIVSSKKVLRSGNDEFGKITRLKRAKKLKLKLNFTNRKQSEVDSSDTYLDNHHPELSFLIRNYQYIPPRDTEVYSLSDETTRNTNGINLWNYSFEAREK
jgi:hypothetical protein